MRINYLLNGKSYTFYKKDNMKFLKKFGGVAALVCIPDFELLVFTV